MLLEIAIGDAYGMGFEFAKPKALKSRPNDGLTYHPHPFHPIAPGHFTDDTQMSIAVAEVILAKGPRATRQDFAEAFVDGFRRDPRMGYSNGFQALLQQVGSGEELLARLRPASIGAGSAMRACPIGVLPNLEQVLRIADLQARITHDTPEGVAAAQGVAAMIHFGLQDGPSARDGLRARLQALDPLLDRALAQPFKGPVPNEGLAALNAALGVVEAARDMREALILSVALGGDVDTVAAVALGALSLLMEQSQQQLPFELISELERGRYGRPHLEFLDTMLREIATRPQHWD